MRSAGNDYVQMEPFGRDMGYMYESRLTDTEVAQKEDRPAPRGHCFYAGGSQEDSSRRDGE